MAVAWLLTFLALSGVWVGVFLGRERKDFSDRFAAAGGGLLFGISLFWLVPEIGETAGRWAALSFSVAVAALLMLFDRLLMHSGHSARRGVIWPLLLATAVHSVLDGWSVTILSVQPVDHFAVAIGLALHKFPEGAAVGWIARRSTGAPWRAFLASAAAELFTLVGAFSEPRINASGAARFGVWWTAGALSVIAGGFVFLALHAVAPYWQRRDVIASFLATFLLVGALTFVRTGAV